jgi:hypothetical protein
MSSRTVSPGLFAGAPRLHSGLFADEFPSILQKGETVIPKGGSGGGMPRSVKVEIINESNQKMKATNATARFDMQEMVVTLWMDAYNRNVGGMRRAIGG